MLSIMQYSTFPLKDIHLDLCVFTMLQWKIFLVTNHVKKEIQGSTPAKLSETVRLL